MPLPDYTTQDAATYKANIDSTVSDLDNKANDWSAWVSAAAVGLTISSSYASKDTISVGSVTDGDTVCVAIRLSGTKGGTAGMCGVQVAEDGTSTASIRANGSGIDPKHEFYIPASYSVDTVFTLMLDVISTGTLVLDMQAKSEGSNLTSARIDTMHTHIAQS